MNFKITNRDIKVFFLGVFAAFIFVIIYDWDEFEEGLKAGNPNITSKIEK